MTKSKLGLALAGAAFCSALTLGLGSASAEGYAYVDGGNQAVNFSDPACSPAGTYLIAWLYLSGNSSTVDVYATNSGGYKRDNWIECTSGNREYRGPVSTSGPSLLTSTCPAGSSYLWADSFLDDI